VPAATAADSFAKPSSLLFQKWCQSAFVHELDTKIVEYKGTLLRSAQVYRANIAPVICPSVVVPQVRGIPPAERPLALEPAVDAVGTDLEISGMSSDCLFTGQNVAF
jgi:hypothetical protein